ncbi:hypothetical protein DFH09DRAFT_1365800 [Mycena vulgaris]|nr:hypothetical protein DFH09DRAFT_1365800 [Mycena vulgaris]
MSDFQALLKQLETVLSHTAASHYTIVSSLCLYAYDFILTFSDEVEYFWGSPWTFVKGLFLWNRYFVFPVIAYLSFSEINRLPTHSLCFAGETVGIILSIVCIGGAQVVMQLRLHALYGQNRTLKIIISLLFFMAVSGELGIAIAKLVTDNGMNTVYLQPIPFLVDPLSLCVGAIPKFLIVYTVPMMTFDTIMLILVVYKAYLIQREETFVTSDETWTGARLMRIMFRDSVIYFACTVGVNLFNLLMWAIGPYDLFTVGTAWAVTIPVMAASRILFNMRKEYRRPTINTLDVDVGTEFQNWSAHKKKCKFPYTPQVQVSPFGQTFNMMSGLSAPLSSTGQFFAPMFGYKARNPERVYADLVNAFRLLRLGSHLNAARVPPEVQNMEFSEWMDKVTRAGIPPAWWDADVHRAGIDAYTREDAWGRLDRVVSRDEIRDSLEKPGRMMGLEMMVERIVNGA